MTLMSNLKQLELALTEKLQLTRRPIAVRFCDAPPNGVLKFEGSVPSGCTFWSLAAAGRTFYTVPPDHFNCPIGSYTHHIDLPEARQAELSGTLQLMSDIGYVRMEEVPAIPRLATTPGVIVYAPLGDCPGDPDVVLVAGQPSKVMLLIETATRAGVPYIADAGAADVHGDSGGDGRRPRNEHGLHRQPRLHEHRR